jgi:hypothetical protein
MERQAENGGEAPDRDADARRELEAVYARAVACSKRGDVAGARDLYQQVIDTAPAVLAQRAAYELGRLLAGHRDWAGAHRAYQAAAASDANGALAARGELGAADVLGELGEQAAQMAGYRRVIASGDKDYAPWAALNLGAVLAEQGEHHAAQDAFRLALASGAPRVAGRAGYSLAISLERGGDHEGAQGRDAGDDRHWRPADGPESGLQPGGPAQAVGRRGRDAPGVPARRRVRPQHVCAQGAVPSRPAAVRGRRCGRCAVGIPGGHRLRRPGHGAQSASQAGRACWRRVGRTRAAFSVSCWNAPATWRTPRRPTDAPPACPTNEEENEDEDEDSDESGSDAIHLADILADHRLINDPAWANKFIALLTAAADPGGDRDADTASERHRHGPHTNRRPPTRCPATGRNHDRSLIPAFGAEAGGTSKHRRQRALRIVFAVSRHRGVPVHIDDQRERKSGRFDHQ